MKMAGRFQNHPIEIHKGEHECIKISAYEPGKMKSLIPIHNVTQEGGNTESNKSIAKTDQDVIRYVQRVAGGAQTGSVSLN